MDEILLTIDKFIEKMKYKENEHVLGIFFYGSYLTGFYNEDSDIDLHVIFDNSNPERLYRGQTMYIDDKRIEYFEKPIGDIYLSVDNDYLRQNNALFSIIGTSKIIFDKTGALKKLQEYAYEKFINGLPPLGEDDARESVSILNNRMLKLRKAAKDNSLDFRHLYHLTIEKIRKFYHRLNGFPEVPTTKVLKVYTDEEYRKSFYKDAIPEEEFIQMYINVINNDCSNVMESLQLVEELYNYAKRNVDLDEKEHRILIRSRNK